MAVSEKPEKTLGDGRGNRGTVRDLIVAAVHGSSAERAREAAKDVAVAGAVSSDR